MMTLLEQIDKGTIWRSPGGIHPPELKTLSNQTSISQLPLAATYIVPIPDVAENSRLLVDVGDKVLKGQTLTSGSGFLFLPVHAPTSGKVIAIEHRPSNHASNLPVLSCVIESDGEDKWVSLNESLPSELSVAEIINKIKQAGIAGLGGAAFPSHIKLNTVSEIDLVIINGVECEPYITADDRLMREYSAEITQGIEIIHRILSPKRIVVAIEDNKPEAAAAMKTALTQSSVLTQCARVTVIPTKYPSGGEKQLIQIITGKEVPSGALPSQLGIVVQNVGTAFAIKQAIYHGKPLIERVVTLTGQQVAKPGNYWLPIGTPIDWALSQVNFSAQPDQKVIIGGPMMGYTTAVTQVPILKGTNCILTPSINEIGITPVEKSCIRCGECAVACPALLLPQQLFWHAKAQEYDKAASFNLSDCIECGCCSYVCPSDIPLVEYYRVAKSALRNEAEEKRLAEQAKIRFDARIARLEEEKLAREAKAKEAAEKRKANMKSTDKDAVAAAMARIAAKKAQNTGSTDKPVATSTQTPPKKAAVNAAIERAKAKKALQAQAIDSQVNQASSANKTDKQDKVAAAIARAKAKKAAQAGDQTSVDKGIESSLTEASSTDDKKAKVAAAIARAKAKKAAQLVDVDSNTAESIPTKPAANAEGTQLDDKKARIAAAIAKAKAKKAAQSDDATSAIDSETETGTNAACSVADDTTELADKKAKIAAAVARAKAKKAAQSQISEEITSENDSVAEQTEADAKKARIAAAVAKAKAKKLAMQNDAEEHKES